jgi:single-strand DNA-binding protein
MNNVNLIGRLTKNPELKQVGDGKVVARLSLAVDDFRSKGERTDFFQIDVWGKQAENCGEYLSKGRLVGVNGRMRSDQYTDASGIKRYPVTVTADNVQFLEWAEKSKDQDKAPADYTPADAGQEQDYAEGDAEQNEDMER